MSDAMHMLDADNAALSARVQELRAELDALRWQVAQADAYGSYMRHCIRPISFAEWLLRKEAQAQAVQP